MLLKPLPLLVALALTGCATQESLVQETQPLQERMGRLEQALKTSEAAGQARHAVLIRDIDGLRDALKALSVQLDGNAAQDAHISARLTQTEAALNSLAATARESVDQVRAGQDALVARTAQSENRLEQLLTESREAADGAAGDKEAMAARLAGSEQRLDQLAKEAREANDAVAAGMAGQAARLAQSEKRQDQLATEAGQAAAGVSADKTAMAARLGQSEQRLDKLTTESQDALARAASDKAALLARLDKTDQRLDAMSASVNAAVAQAMQENIRQNGKEAFSLSLTEDKTLYPINSPELGRLDVAKLDRLVEKVNSLGQEYHLEIRGHTDNLGTDDYNYELGKARANVVKRYLNDRKAISLSHMSVISFGAGNPADRKSPSNRRIDIRVLVLK